VLQSPIDSIRVLGVLLYQEFGQGVTLAGGCIRNPLTDRGIKDIDLFLESEALVEPVATFLGCIIEQTPLAVKADGSPYADACLPDLSEMKVWKCDAETRTKLYIPVDIIWVPSVHGRIAKFPDYISRMWLEGPQAQVVMASEARQDLDKRQIRYWASQMREKRLARFKELYGPGWGNPPWEFIDLEEAQEITHTPKQAARRAKDEAYAPMWWDLPPIEQRAEAAWKAMHDLCEMSRR
jgi:hypothetical protein